MSFPIGPTSLDLPAWVQAVGSVAALVLAIAFWQLDRISRRRERAGEQKDKQTEAIRLVKLVADQISSRKAEVRSIPHLLEMATADASVVEEAKSILHEHVLNYLERFVALPLDKWPDAAIATAYFDGVDGIRVSIQKFIRMVDEDLNRDAIWLEQLIAQAQQIEASFSFFERYRAGVEVRLRAAESEGIDVRYPAEKLVDDKLRDNRL